LSKKVFVIKTFSELALIPEIASALRKMNYSEPTPIQAGAIPPLLEGKDLLGCAQTGTGKTAAFGIPLIQQLHTSGARPIPNHPLALILAPTRELVSQIAENLGEIGKQTRIRHTMIYGGVGQRPQIAALTRGVHILIATPGRLLDLVGQGHLNLTQLRHFVLDEADRMLDLGFMPDIQRIVRILPRQRQSIFLSATMPPPIEALAATLLQKHVTVMVAPPATTAERVKQRVMLVAKGNKRKLLDLILADKSASRVLVFMKTKHGADRLYKSMAQCGLSADGIHSGRSQNARQRVLNAFRNGEVRVLVCTDVAARGIDIDNVSHVINYDVPHDPDSYVHRIGRTARAGASGESITFCDSDEYSWLQEIEKLIDQSIPVDTDHPFHAPDVADEEVQFFTRNQGRPTKGRTKSGRTKSESATSRRPERTKKSSRPKASRNSGAERSSGAIKSGAVIGGGNSPGATKAEPRKSAEPRKFVATRTESGEAKERRSSSYEGREERGPSRKKKPSVKRRRSLSGKVKKIKLMDAPSKSSSRRPSNYSTKRR
jgi:ATP-dependent RNA helicase RhlE